jgi:outer membrane lipoprotein-sorting protein
VSGIAVVPVRGRAARRALVAWAASCLAASSMPAQRDSADATVARALHDTSTTLLDRAAARYGAMRSLRATFEQTHTNPGTSGARTAKGELFQRGAWQFALRYSDPAGDAIVSDDSALWVYLPSTMKGQVLKLPRAAGAGFDFLAHLLSAPRAHYAVRAVSGAPVPGHETTIYDLQPKDGNAPFTRARLWIGRADTLLWQVETVELSGMLRRVRFDAIHPGAALPKASLRFTLPPGTRVIDQAALLGGRGGPPRP